MPFRGRCRSSRPRDIDPEWLRNTLTLFETGDGAAMQPAPVAEPPGA